MVVCMCARMREKSTFRRTWLPRDPLLQSSSLLGSWVCLHVPGVSPGHLNCGWHVAPTSGTWYMARCATEAGPGIGRCPGFLVLGYLVSNLGLSFFVLGNARFLCFVKENVCFIYWSFSWWGHIPHRSSCCGSPSDLLGNHTPFSHVDPAW